MTDLVATAVRMMDNVVDASRFPLEAQQTKELAKIIQDADPFRYSVNDAGYTVAARPPRIIHLGMSFLAQNIDRVIQIIELPVQS